MSYYVCSIISAWQIYEGKAPTRAFRHLDLSLIVGMQKTIGNGHFRAFYENDVDKAGSICGQRGQCGPVYVGLIMNSCRFVKETLRARSEL